MPMLRLVAGKDRVRFTDVKKSFVSVIMLLKAYLSTKLARLAKRYIPEKVLRKALAFYVKVTTPN